MAKTFTDVLTLIKSFVLTQVVAVSDDVTSLDGRLDTAETTITNHTNSINTINTDINTIESNVSTLTTNLTTTTNELSDLTDVVGGNITSINNLNTDISNLTSDINANTTDIIALQTSVSTNSSNISSLDTRLDTAESEIDTLQADISTIETNISTIETNISTIETNISTIETNITTLQSNVSTNTTNISTNTSNITSLDGRLDTAESNISTLQSSVSTNTTNIATNTTNIGTLQSDVTALDGRLDTAESNITTLQTNVSTNTTNISTNTSNISGLDTRLDTAESDIDTLQSQISGKQNTLVANDITTSLIADNAVTLPKINTTGATAGQVPTFNGTNVIWDDVSGGAGLVDGDYGDITVSSTGTVMTIDNGAINTDKLADNSVSLSKIIDAIITGAKLVANTISFSKIQTISTAKLLGRTTAGSGDIEELDINNYKNYELNTSATSSTTYNKSDLSGKYLIALANGQTFRVGTGFSTGDVLVFFVDGANTSSGGSITFDGIFSYQLSTGFVQCIYDGTKWYLIGSGSSWISNIDQNQKTTLGGANVRSTRGTGIGSGTFITSGLNDATAVGTTATISGDYSNVFGSRTNDGGFAYSLILGYLSRGRRYGSIRYNAGIEANIFGTGNPSFSGERIFWNGTTTNNTITEIFLRGVSSNRCVLQAKNVLSFRGQCVAFRSTYAGSARWSIEGLIKRDGSNNTTLVGVTATLTHSDGTGGTLVLTIDADDTNESLRVRVTGNSSETWTWGVELEILDLRIA